MKINREKRKELQRQYSIRVHERTGILQLQGKEHLTKDADCDSIF